MPHRNLLAVAAAAVPLAAGALLIAGCTGVIRDPPPPPLRHLPFGQRAAQVLHSWQASGAAARWQRGLKNRWFTGLVLLDGPDLSVSADGLPEDAFAVNARWRDHPAMALQARAPRPGTVTFPGRSAKLTVPLISAAAAYQALRGHSPPSGCTGRACAVVTVTSAAMVTVTVATSRGLAAVPAWQFTVAGYQDDIDEIAIVPAMVTALPRFLLRQQPDPRYVPLASARADPRDPRRITIGLVTPPGDSYPHIAAVQTAGAVIVAAQVTGTGYGPRRGTPYQATITLTAPLGQRVLLDASTGLPLAVRSQPGGPAGRHTDHMSEEPSRRVGARIVLEARQPFEAVVQVAVSVLAGTQLEETLSASLDGEPAKLTEIAMPGGGRAHLLRCDAGQLTVDYQAAVRGSAEPPEVTEADRITFVRPSRYAESDRLAAVARAEFAGLAAGPELLAAVSSWVGTRLSYLPGSSRPTDGAVETLLLRQGVCRDYAHLVIALLRALDIPARMAAVYAPGLEPMDFHAVAEALVGGQWRVVDATLLAPRASLVRIATGRDAADTAFLSTYGGAADLTGLEVTAVTQERLPADEVTELVSLS